MGLFEKIKKMFSKKESLKSEHHRSEIDDKSIKSSTETENSQKIQEEYTEEGQELSIKSDYESNKSDLKSNVIDQKEQKLLLKLKKEDEEQDKLSLGIKIGYMLNATKNIEESIFRIETNLVTKDWIKNEFSEYYKKLIESIRSVFESIKEYEKGIEERLLSIESTLNKIEEITKNIKDEAKEKILEEISEIRKNLPLTPRMKRILEIVKEKGEISYEELSGILGISVSALRGLLSEMCRRTTDVERFERDNKGWLRFAGSKDN